IQNLQLIDVATSVKRALTTGSDSYVSPRFSPDGARVACLFHENQPKKTGRTVLAVIDVASGKIVRPCDALDLWPNAPVWSNDGATIWFTADERGEVPIFAVDVGTGRVRRVAVGGGYSDVRPSPDGRFVYALFSTFDRPPEVVVVDARATDGKPERLTH